MAHEPTWDASRLAEANDENLVLLAQRHPALEQAAARILTIRHQESLRLMIARKARLRGLAFHDAEDAVQEIYFWVLEAMSTYDPGHASNPRPFRPFLERVVRSRLCNYFDRIQRHRSDYDPTVELTELVDCRSTNAGANAAAIADSRELLARLALARQQLAFGAAGCATR